MSPHVLEVISLHIYVDCIIYEMPLHETETKYEPKYDTMSCYANLHSVSDLQISMGRINLKYGQITMYNLIWNFVKGFPL